MRRLLFACATAVVLIVGTGCEDILTPIGDPVDLSYSPCLGSPDNPTWFAFQDGDGGWQQVNQSVSGSYNFAIASGRGGIALYYPPDGFDPEGLQVIYATTEEFQSVLPACNSSVRTVTGSVTGYATADNVQLQMGTINDVIFGSTTPPASFVLSGVDAPATDLVAVRYRTSSGGGSAFEAFPKNVFIRRNISGTSAGTVDFSSTTEAGAPLQRTLNVTNIGTGDALGVYSYLGLGSTLANIAAYEGSAALVSGSVTAPFYGIPAARLNAGETQMVRVLAVKSVGSGEEGRIGTFVFTNPLDQSFTLGPALGTVTVTGSSRPTAAYNVQAAYDKLFDAVFTQGNGTSFRQEEIIATSGYLNGATSVSLQAPNLTGVGGFQSSWLLSTGVQSFWYFTATDAPLALLNSKALTYQGADRNGTFTP